MAMPRPAPVWSNVPPAEPLGRGSALEVLLTASNFPCRSSPLRLQLVNQLIRVSPGPEICLHHPIIEFSPCQDRVVGAALRRGVTWRWFERGVDGR